MYSYYCKTILLFTVSKLPATKNNNNNNNINKSDDTENDILGIYIAKYKLSMNMQSQYVYKSLNSVEVSLKFTKI